MPEIEDLTNRHLVKIAGAIRSRLLMRRLHCCRNVQSRIDRITAAWARSASLGVLCGFA